MNVTLVDHLVCPRCGPPHGLLLLAHDVRDRRVREGEFGCANCRDRFPVSNGFGDLRPPPRGAGQEGGAGADELAGGAGVAGEEPSGRELGAESAPERALRLAAAVGVTRGPGLIVVADGHRGEAPHLAKLVRGIEVLVVGWGGRGLAAGGAGDGGDGNDGVSVFVTGPRLPLRDGTVRGVVADGASGEGMWDEGRRVLVAGGRIVITAATREAREWVRGAGLGVVLDEGGMVVGVVPVPGEVRRLGRGVGAGPKRSP